MNILLLFSYYYEAACTVFLEFIVDVQPVYLNTNFGLSVPDQLDFSWGYFLNKTSIISAPAPILFD